MQGVVVQIITRPQGGPIIQQAMQEAERRARDAARRLQSLPDDDWLWENLSPEGRGKLLYGRDQVDSLELADG